MSTVKEEVAKNLLYYRKKNKLTQSELAERVGVSHNTISSWESGTNSIDVEVLFKICSVFEISVNEMYGTYSNVQTESLNINERNLLYNFRSFNDEGQEKVLSYVDDILTSGKYIKNYSSGLVEEKKAK